MFIDLRTMANVCPEMLQLPYFLRRYLDLTACFEMQCDFLDDILYMRNRKLVVVAAGLERGVANDSSGFFFSNPQSAAVTQLHVSVAAIRRCISWSRY